MAAGRATGSAKQEGSNHYGGFTISYNTEEYHETHVFRDTEQSVAGSAGGIAADS